MRPRPFRLEATTRRERHAAVRAVERAVKGAGGWVTDFRQFSNFAVVLELQITTDGLRALCAAAEAEGVYAGPAPGYGFPEAEGSEELAGTLRIDFLHDEPELRIPVPEVPG